MSNLLAAELYATQVLDEQKFDLKLPLLCTAPKVWCRLSETDHYP